MKRISKEYKSDIIIVAALVIALFAGFKVCDKRAEQLSDAINEGAFVPPYTVETAATGTVEPVAKAAPVQAVAEQPKQTANEITVIATAYCSCAKCCGKTDGITATGTKATAGRTIAADPSIYPYGTKIVIGGNTYIVEDCGGAIKGNRIDIYFDSHAEALKFGRRILTAQIEA